jgi:uncharacterized protein (TIRG00374 family)
LPNYDASTADAELSTEEVASFGHACSHNAPAFRDLRQVPTMRDLRQGKFRTRRLFRISFEVSIFAALTVFVWLGRMSVIQSLGIVERANWSWLLAACAFELLSMMAFARTQRIVLRAAGVRASIPSVAATALVGNAMSVSIPLIGPGVGSAFTHRRFRQGAHDPAPATWTLLISGLISNVLWILLVAIGATVSGNVWAAFSGIFGGAAIVLTATFGVLALHRPRARELILRVGARVLRSLQRVKNYPSGDAEDAVRAGLDELSVFRMRFRDWMQTVVLATINWLASVGCFVAAILAVKAGVPWTRVVLVYCAGTIASSFNVTPGGLGVTEGVLTAGLVASGLKPGLALGSALAFRLVSFWLVALVGWIVFAGLRRGTALRAVGTE